MIVFKIKYLPSQIFCAVLALASVLGAGQVAAAVCPDVNPKALQWLDRMSRSAYEESYQGVVTLQRGDDMQVMQIAHSVSGRAASESLTQLTGQGAQVVRVQHPLDCIHPGHKLLRLSTELDSHSVTDPMAGQCGLSDHYRFSVAVGERVAGRMAVRIIISPKDMYRYGYVMELDQQTALLLKTETIGRGEKVLERFQFAGLSYGEQPNRGTEVNLVHRASHPVLINDPGQPSKNQYLRGDWHVDWVPGGFTVTDSVSGDTSRRTYTDGLAVFSVFLEMLPRDIQPGEGVVRSGGTTSYSRGLHLSGKPALVTVIGEIPVNTARMVADSIARVQ